MTVALLVVLAAVLAAAWLARRMRAFSGGGNSSLELLALMTAITLLPAALLMMTAFTRIIIVLSILRQAIGAGQSPPNQVLIGLALFLTLFVMSPVIDKVRTDAVMPYMAGTIDTTTAFNIDPLRGVESPALGQLYVILGTLTFIALDGHVALIETLVASFHGLPIGPSAFPPQVMQSLADWGNQMFLGAVRIALPGTTALLVINLAFGVTSRAAPSLHLFAVGLPVALVFGMVVVWLGLPSMQTGFLELLNSAFEFLRARGGAT